MTLQTTFCRSFAPEDVHVWRIVTRDYDPALREELAGLMKLVWVSRCLASCLNTARKILHTSTCCKGQVADPRCLWTCRGRLSPSVWWLSCSGWCAGWLDFFPQGCAQDNRRRLPFLHIDAGIGSDQLCFSFRQRCSLRWLGAFSSLWCRVRST